MGGSPYSRWSGEEFDRQDFVSSLVSLHINLILSQRDEWDSRLPRPLSLRVSLSVELCLQQIRLRPVRTFHHDSGTPAALSISRWERSGVWICRESGAGTEDEWGEAERDQGGTAEGAAFCV